MNTLFLQLLLCLTVAFAAPPRLYDYKLLHCDSPTVIPGEHIVQYHDFISLKQSDNHIQSLGVDVQHRLTSVMNGFTSKSLTDEHISQLLRHPLVKSVECAQEVHVSDCSKPEKAESWGLSRISQSELVSLQQYTYPEVNGERVVAYIIDTGIYVENEDFGSRAEAKWKAETWWSDTDENGHGTHVASTVGGVVYGVAPMVDAIYGVKVLGDNGSGSTAGVIGGVDFVGGDVPNGKRAVANLSLGGGRSSTLDAAVNALMKKSNVFVAVAAGNENSDACGVSPARASVVATVGSTTIMPNGKSPEDARSYFSNYGQCVDVFAPGSDITAAWIGSPSATNTISGTSMASPHVAGVGALLLAADRTMSAEDVKAAILQDSTSQQISFADCGNSVCANSPNKLLFNGC